MDGIEKVCKFLEECGVYYLATADGDQPRVRPFGTVNMKVKPVSRQLAANPKAEICAFKDGKWIRVSGELANDDRIEAKAAMLDKYPSLKGMYSAEDGNTQVLYFKGEAVIASFGGAPETIAF